MSIKKTKTTTKLEAADQVLNSGLFFIYSAIIASQSYCSFILELKNDASHEIGNFLKTGLQRKDQ